MSQITLYDVMDQSLQTIPVDNLQTYRLDISRFSECMYFASVQITKVNTATHKIIKKE